MYRLTCPSNYVGSETMCCYCPVYSNTTPYSPYMYRETPLDDEFEDEIFIGQPLDFYMERLPEAHKSFTTEEAIEIAEELGIKFDKFNVEQFRMGLDVELEHGTIDPETDVTGDDPILTGKIALAHLREFPDYYTRLNKMEEEAETYWEGRE